MEKDDQVDVEHENNTVYLLSKICTKIKRATTRATAVHWALNRDKIEIKILR